MRRLGLLATLIPLTALSAQDDPPIPPAEPEPVCVRAEIVPGFEQWGHADADAPTVGRTATLTLREAGKGDAAPPPARPAQPDGFGGVFPLHVARPGIYLIAISEAAGLDLAAKGKKVDALAGGRGPACSGIRKINTYLLPADDYVVQISEAHAATIALAVAAGSDGG